jgi:hypothetical protein
MGNTKYENLDTASMISEFSFNSDAKAISPSGEFALESLRLN